LCSKERLARDILSKFNEMDSAQRELCIGSIKKAFGTVKIYGDHMTWNQVREVAKHGISIGSHTITHQALTHISLEEAKNEIVYSKTKIEQEINKEVKAFSYPHGIYNDAITAIVKKSGYECAFTTDERINVKGCDMFTLGRHFF
jgi:hypothetical protein